MTQEEINKKAKEYSDFEWTDEDMEFETEKKVTIQDFKAGVDFIQSKMYSEEEVLKLFEIYQEKFSLKRNIQVLKPEFNEWFKSVKK